MLTLILGTDWVANRQEILKYISNDVSFKKGGRILIVPELISHDTERRLCAAAGDTASRYAEVLSFTRLARRVAESVGQATQECLDDGGRVVAMASAARQLHNKLKAYAAVETKPEFLVALVDAVDEFKRCCITAEDLLDASKKAEGNFAQKLEELSLLLDCYDGLCENGKKDPRDQMTWLLEELECSNYASEHAFYIDGFPDFTRQHMAILEHLICNCSDVTISLNCDVVNSSAFAFQKAGQTAAELIRCAQNFGVEVKICSVEPRKDDLVIVRDRLFQGALSKIIANNCLKLYRAQSIYQECIAAAERVVELVQDGARYRDISVVCSDVSAYGNTIEMIFNRCHIPTYQSGTESVLSRPVIVTVLAALDAALGGFESADVMRYLKSALSPIDLSVCDRIENYAILWNVNGNHWLEQWQAHPEGLGAEWTDEIRCELRELNSAKQNAVQPLEELRKAFADAENLGEQIKAVYHFLEKIDFDSRLKVLADELDSKGDNRNAQILNQLWEILLAALEQMYDTLGHTSWSTETFTRLFRLLLSQYDVGTIPPVLDSVTFGPVNAMRCQQAKHVIVLGATEGCMPGYGGSAGVLTDQERTALRQMGVPLTGGSMDGMQAEFAEIYGVFCGAEETITVSCCGDQPSFVYRRLAEMAGNEFICDHDLGAAMTDALEAGAYLVRFDAITEAKALGIDDSYEKIAQKKQHTLGSVSRESIQKLYGSKLNLSASQVDKHADCRMSYFIKYGLRAKERKTAEIDPAEFGTYVHAVLENTAREIMNAGGFKHISCDDALAIARKFSEEYAQERFGNLDAKRLVYLFQRNTEELELIVRELWEELHNCGFEPIDFELGFGANGKMPAIQIHGDHMDAQLRGFVDRVDMCNTEKNTYFRVVDYKTGRKDFDYCDVFNGLGLQMLLYLFALEEEGKELLGCDSIPAGVQYFPARVPLVSADGILSAEEAEAAREKLWKRKGLVLSDDDAMSAMEAGDQLPKMPYSRKKDGSVSGDIATRDQFKILRSYIFGLLKRMVDEIASGDVAPNPYTRGSSHNACAFCPYGAVCHQQSVEQRRNYKAMTAQRFWEEVDKEVSANG